MCRNSNQFSMTSITSYSLISLTPIVGTKTNEIFLSSLGISVIDGDKGRGVTMELELKWDGNPKIELDIRTLVGVKLPVRVNSILLFIL